MVSLVQLVEHQIVVLGVVGSSPTGYPKGPRSNSGVCCFMKKILSVVLALALLAFCLVCRFVPGVGEWYALNLYPWISGVLSLVSSPFPFSLEEVIVLGFVGYLIYIIVRSIRKRSFGSWLGSTLLTILWLYVWLYMGWENNYFRSSFYERGSLERVAYDEKEFMDFLSDYSYNLDASYCKVESIDKKALCRDIKDFYRRQDSSWGLTTPRSWQRPKRPLINILYSSVGVLGFMGPFAGESQLNADLLPSQYPFTLAHELAHLYGVSSEAEANYWAYKYCTGSSDKAVRYSGYFSLLGYVWSNAAGVLPKDSLSVWLKGISPEIMEEYAYERDYWNSKRVNILDKTQTVMMEANLRSNGISEGAKNYNQVVGMILSERRKEN